MQKDWTTENVKQALQVVREELELAEEYDKVLESAYGGKYLHDRRIVKAFYRKVLTTFESPFQAYHWHRQIGFARGKGHNWRMGIVVQAFKLHDEVAPLIGKRRSPGKPEASPLLQLRLAAMMLTDLFETVIHVVRPFVQRLLEGKEPVGSMTAGPLLDCLAKVAPVKMSSIIDQLRLQERNGISHADYLVDEKHKSIIIYDRRKGSTDEGTTISQDQLLDIVNTLLTYVGVFTFQWLFELHSALKWTLEQIRVHVRRGY